MIKYFALTLSEIGLGKLELVVIGIVSIIFPTLFIIAEKIARKKLSVRQTESLVRLLKNTSSKKKISKDPNTISIEKHCVRFFQLLLQ